MSRDEVHAALLAAYDEGRRAGYGFPWVREDVSVKQQYVIDQAASLIGMRIGEEAAARAVALLPALYADDCEQIASYVALLCELVSM